MNDKVTFEQKDDKFFGDLGIVCALVGYEGKDYGEVWTQEDLNSIVGKMAYHDGLDLMTDGITFLRNVRERLVPNMEEIAQAVAKKKLDVTGDIGEFKVCENPECAVRPRHGMLVSAFGAATVDSFEEAVKIIKDAVNRQGMCTAVGAYLLQQVLTGGMPLLKSESVQLPVTVTITRELIMTK